MNKIVIALCILIGFNASADYAGGVKSNKIQCDAIVAKNIIKAPQSQVLELIDEHFYKVEVRAIAIFLGESKLGKDPQYTAVDITADGCQFSHGVGQINLTVHDLGIYNCPDAFEGRNSNARVIDMVLYEKCVWAANNPSINIAKARSIYNKEGWGAWGAFGNGSYRNHISKSRMLAVINITKVK